MRNARPVQGRYRDLRSAANAALIAILFAIPWIRVAGEPLLLFDIPARKFHVFGLVIFPQELIYLWALIAIVAVALFFFTAILGRVWCGWACPQTVFTDVFAGFERRIEGWKGNSRPRRVAAWRISAKHAVWVILSFLVAFHAVGYFVSPYAWISRIEAGTLGAGTGFLLVLTAITWADFVYVRQAFCRYICPYARFQGVLFDRDTLVIGYDTDRGEPRGKRGSTTGDCVDCGLCVQVCPASIDIREGLQLDCIACTQCIDACDGVMSRLGRERGLIDYRALASLEEKRPARLVRPRTVVYGTLLAASLALFVGLVGARVPVGFEVFHNRDALTTVLPDGRIGNSFEVRLENRGGLPRRYALRLVSAPGGFELLGETASIDLAPEQSLRTTVFVVAPRGEVNADGSDLEFAIEPLDGAHAAVTRAARFLAPAEISDA